MRTFLDEIQNKFNPQDSDEMKLAIREAVQSIILLALSKTDFFSKAGFYGGTSLRIFYNLNRFSEDLDFTLFTGNPDFSLIPYFKEIERTTKAYGITATICKKEKKTITAVDSAFAKMNTYQTFIDLEVPSKMLNGIHKDEVINVKFEIDCLPAMGFKCETKWILWPEYAPVTTLDLPSLFAGKIAAVLCRNYKNRVKGRDFYDFLFYTKMDTPINMVYLKNQLVASGKIKENDHFDLPILKSMLHERFSLVDFEQVKAETKRFLKSQNEDISYYCQELFDSVADALH